MYAKTQADILVASLTCDEHIEKANFRPYVPEDLRAMNLAALAVVDYVVIDREATPLRSLEKIKPDYYAKGYEYMDGGIHPKTLQEIEVLEKYGGEILFTPGDVVFSSSALIEQGPPNILLEKLTTLMHGEGITFDDLRSTLDKMATLKVHVVGDTIVDSYTRCSLIGGGTKTPTLSVRYEEKENFVGGAGIVSKHLRAAGAEVDYTTVLGDDEYADFVLDDLAAAGVKCDAVTDPNRPTTNKNAVVADGYRLLKIDTLDNRAISEKIVNNIAQRVRSVATDIVVFSDFRHGVFNQKTVPIFTNAIPEGTFRVADSQVASRWGNILDFQGFDLITPNEHEARFSLGDQDSVVQMLAHELFQQAHCRTLILKMGERGHLTYRSRRPGDPRTIVSLDSIADRMVDSVGAGDALLAYAALAYKVMDNDVIATILGGIAGGIECECDGNLPVTPDAVREKIDYLEESSQFSFG
ncbi:PfkB family carbohydrate kinase [Alphaproteobacteria bacterium]|nr:PfkB family carbohydrate kinase [Alphaproteobacteria bacterium]